MSNNKILLNIVLMLLILFVIGKYDAQNRNAETNKIINDSLKRTEISLSEDMKRELIKITKDLPDSEIEQAVYRYSLDQVYGTEYSPMTVKDRLIRTQKLPDVLYYFIATKLFEDEVDNGGYPSYFYNQHGELIYAVHDGFKEFGSDEASEEVLKLIRNLDEVKDLKKGVGFAIKNNTTIEDYYADEWEKIEFPKEDKFYSLESEISIKRLKYFKKSLNEK